MTVNPFDLKAAAGKTCATRCSDSFPDRVVHLERCFRSVGILEKQPLSCQSRLLQPDRSSGNGSGSRGHGLACMAIATGGPETSGKPAVAFESGRLLGRVDLVAHLVANTTRTTGGQQPKPRVLGTRAHCRRGCCAYGTSGRHPERSGSTELTSPRIGAWLFWQCCYRQGGHTPLRDNVSG
jgi:hypothetical protein